ncbi:MAG: protein kinase, partial [Bdellovibrionales bacterium]|nr:protein kinase [Bdellovibrionales bacterium]
SSSTPYLVMDFVSGESFDVLLKRVGHLAPEKAVFYLDQIANAIDYAHRQGVVHRDLKPANCMLEVNDRLYVLDFGIAKIQSHFTGIVAQEETIVGTPAYMAPEQIRNERVLPATDLFSFAVLAYQTITGKRPFDGSSYTETMGNILSNEPLPLNTHVSLPLSLEAVFSQALAKDPSKRFPTARKFVEAFAAACKIRDIHQLSERERSQESKRIAVWDAGQRNQASRTLFHGNFSAPVVPAAHTLGPGGIFSHNDKGLKENVKIDRKGPLIRWAIAGFSVLALLSGATLLSISLDTTVDTSLESIPVIQDIPGNESQRLRVVVGEELAVPTDKMVSAMTDAELSATLVSDSITNKVRLEALREVENRNLPSLRPSIPYLLKSESYVVRSELLNILGRMKDSAAVPYMIPALNDLDPTVRKAASDAFSAIGSRKAVGALKQRYAQETDRVVKQSLKNSVEKITGLPFPGSATS